jgi:hypothetical protein
MSFVYSIALLFYYTVHLDCIYFSGQRAAISLCDFMTEHCFTQGKTRIFYVLSTYISDFKFFMIS